ncbi:hypothetical protein Q5752_000986 [Cryptotrichosporon argae]
MAPLTVPKRPDDILTAVFPATPDKQTSTLLAKEVTKIIEAPTTYSVTFSPLLCPAGRNYLYTLKPYFWEEGGKWVRRDGRKNPYCEQAQGQKQLEQLALAIRTLAWGTSLPALAARCNAEAEHLLRVFFVDNDTKMLPEVLYAQCIPDKLEGTQTFVIAMRYLILVSQSVHFFKLPAALDAALRSWFRAQVDWMLKSDQGTRARDNGNNIAFWYHAIIRTHLSYLDPAASLKYARDALTGLRAARARPADLFADELARTRPAHYTLFALEAIFLIVGHPPAPSSAVVTRTGADADASVASTLAWLKELVKFAHTVKPGELEAVVEGEGRYQAQLAWYERMLQAYAGWPEGRRDEGPDGRGWEGGWLARAKVAWGMI